jgi:hypothetical protein
VLRELIFDLAADGIKSAEFVVTAAEILNGRLALGRRKPGIKWLVEQRHIVAVLTHQRLADRTRAGALTGSRGDSQRLRVHTVLCPGATPLAVYVASRAVWRVRATSRCKAR